jgi:hypothetical protein
MRLPMILKVVLILTNTLLFANCDNKQSAKEQTQNQQTMLRAEQIKIDGLMGALTKLQNGQTEYQFIGITSNGVDCIFFVYENGIFNLEFEAMGKDQLPFIDKLAEFSKSNNFKNLMTTYNNQPNYQSDKPAPVLRIETNATIDEVTRLGAKIQSEIFLNDDKTVYDVVP